MLLQLTAIILFLTSLVGGQQQCSYVTVPVCGDDVTVTPGSLMRTVKGPVGPPGKRGPRGLPGKKGDTGPVGQKEIESALPNSCWTSLVNGYQRFISNNQEAVCEDGWRVFQRRCNGSVDFNRNWQEYKDGFGNMEGEFWLGLDELHRMTSGHLCRLHVKLVAFDDSQAFAQYNSFSIGNSSDNYRLHVSGYNGTAGDSLAHHNGMQFSTQDRDNDMSPISCALLRGESGGWWYRSCFYSALNAEWGNSTDSWHNMIWYHWQGAEKKIKESTMKIRCD